jgi:hypothetical protein
MPKGMAYKDIIIINIATKAHCTCLARLRCNFVLRQCFSKQQAHCIKKPAIDLCDSLNWG